MSKLWEFVGDPLDGQYKDDNEVGFMGDPTGATAFGCRIKGKDATYRREMWLKKEVMLYQPMSTDNELNDKRR